MPPVVNRRQLKHRMAERSLPTLLKRKKKRILSVKYIDYSSYDAICSVAIHLKNSKLYLIVTK